MDEDAQGVSRQFGSKTLLFIRGSNFVSISLLLGCAVLWAVPIANCQQPAAVAKPKKTKTPPPVLSCNANREAVNRGDIVVIKINSGDGNLIFAFGASAGTLIVTQNVAQLNTAGVPDKVSEITVVCSAVDTTGHIVQATATVKLPPVMFAKPLVVHTPEPATKFQGSTVIAPSIAWTAGTTTQTISGGSLLLSEVKSTSYCDPKLSQFGLAANALDTSTAKLSMPAVNVDNNELSLGFTSAFGGKVNEDQVQQMRRNLDKSDPPKYANSYFGVNTTFLDNNVLGVGLQQTYAVNYQYYLRSCYEKLPPPLDADGAPKHPRVFASIGIGAGYMSQRLYATQDKVNSAVLPLTAQISYLHSNKAGVPPKFFAFANLGFMPVLNDLRAYQLGIASGVQIPTRFPWLTFSLSDSELYMNNAPTGFKRNYQNGTVTAMISFPAPPAKPTNPLLPKSAYGACYGGDKLGRLYCYDDVTADACAPPSMFRALQHCVSSGGGSLLNPFQEQIRPDLLHLDPKAGDDKKQ
jgi:hypothetical protein